MGDDGWATFDSVEELLEVHRSYSKAPFDQFEGLVLVGNDGGGEAFCFDRDGTVVMVAFISDKEDNVTVGSFREFIGRLGAGRLLDEDGPDSVEFDSPVKPVRSHRSAELAEFARDLGLRPGASTEAIARLERELDIRFPADYVDFLMLSDGAEGTIGDWHLVLYSTAELLVNNRAWIERGLERFFVIR